MHFFLFKKLSIVTRRPLLCVDHFSSTYQPCSNHKQVENWPLLLGTFLPTFWRGPTNMYKIRHCIDSEAYTSVLSGTAGHPA